MDKLWIIRYHPKFGNRNPNHFFFVSNQNRPFLCFRSKFKLQKGTIGNRETFETVIDLISNSTNDFFGWVQHTPYDSKFLQAFCKSSKNFINGNNIKIVLILDHTKFCPICNQASYFCESDFENNFAIRRQPTFFLEAVANCRNESSFLTSSKSVSEINYAKKGFTGAKGLNHRDAVLSKTSH